MTPEQDTYTATWVLTAPRLCGGRHKAERLVESTVLDLTHWKVVIQFPSDALATTTFFDQLISRLILDRCAAMVEFRNTSPFMDEAITKRAQERCVVDRVSITDSETE